MDVLRTNTDQIKHTEFIDLYIIIVINDITGFLDGSQGCKSGTVKTEFPSTRNNSGSCSIDVTDVLASVTPILQEKWMYIYYGKSASHPAKSCLDIFQHDPLTPSGMYWIKGFNGVPTQVYCEMEGSNNCDGAGGWMRVYKLDLESSNTDFHNCPSADFEKYDGLGSNKNLCRRVSTAAVCRSAYFSVNDVSYSKVCGKAKGYQKGTTDAFYRGGGAHSKNVDDNYVDGISITHGNPRTHIFTLACGCSESGYCWIYSRCPCQSGQNPPVPKFIGHDDFYCEAASYWHPSWGTWYTEPVWDAKNCDWKEAPCCSVTDNIPWFYKTLSNPTSDSIEVRVCTDETTDGEDVGVSQLELYVK